MSNFNLLGLSCGDKVFVSVAKAEGLVVDIGVDSALVELDMPIEGSINRTKLVKQWYKNEVLKKIEPTPVNCPVSAIEVTTEAKEVTVEEIEKTLEFGVPSGSQKVKTNVKKNKRNK